MLRLALAFALFYAAYLVYAASGAMVVTVFLGAFGFAFLYPLLENIFLRLVSEPTPNNSYSGSSNVNDAAYHYKLGNAALRENQLHDAIEHYSRAISLNPAGWPAYANMGAAYMSLREYSDALRAMDTTLSMNPYEAGTIANRSRVKRELHDYAGSLQDIDTAISYDPRNPSHYINRNQTKRSLGDYRGAIRDCTDAIPMAHEYPALEGLLYWHRALGKFNLEDWSGAIDDLNRSLSFSPKDAYSFLWRGAVKLKLGKIDQALEDYHTGFMLCTGSQGALLRDSLSHIEQERFTEGLALLHTAAKEDDSLKLLIEKFEKDLGATK